MLQRQREKEGTKPNELAEPRLWAIRAEFSLTGLPPTREQIQRLEKDPQQWAKLLDEWMANPAYGERWARHWMDLMRYGDSKAYEADYLMANVGKTYPRH